MRLIDADVLTKVLQRTSVFECIRNSADKNVFEIIDEQPTAYDAEKVVAEMDKNRHIDRSYDEVDFSVYLEDAIEIVRKGGVE